jgi:hypothetical protein
MQFVFGNSIWATGQSGTAPSIWGNHEAVNNNGTAIPNTVVSSITYEIANPTTGIVQILNTTVGEREIVVLAGQPALLGAGRPAGIATEQFYFGEEELAPNGMCIYTFAVTVNSPAIGTLGICS